MPISFPTLHSIHPVLSPEQTPSIDPLVEDTIRRIPYANGAIHYAISLKNVDATCLSDWLMGMTNWIVRPEAQPKQFSKIERGNPALSRDMKKAQTPKEFLGNFVAAFQEKALTGGSRLLLRFQPTGDLIAFFPEGPKAPKEVDLYLECDRFNKSYRLGIDLNYIDLDSYKDKGIPAYPHEEDERIKAAKRYVGHAFYALQRLIDLERTNSNKSGPAPDILITDIRPDEALQALKSGKAAASANELPTFKEMASGDPVTGRPAGQLHDAMVEHFGENGALLAGRAHDWTRSLAPIGLHVFFRDNGLDSNDSEKTAALLNAFQRADWTAVYDLGNRVFVQALASQIGADPSVFHYWMNRHALQAAADVMNGETAAKPTYIDDPEIREWLRANHPLPVFAILFLRALYEATGMYAQDRPSILAANCGLIPDILAFLGAYRIPDPERIRAIADLTPKLEWNQYLSYPINQHGKPLRDLERQLGVPASVFYYSPSRDGPVVEKQLKRKPRLDAYLWHLRRTLGLSVKTFAKRLDVPLKKWRAIEANAEATEEISLNSLKDFCEKSGINFKKLENALKQAYGSDYYFRLMKQSGHPIDRHIAQVRLERPTYRSRRAAQSSRETPEAPMNAPPAKGTGTPSGSDSSGGITSLSTLYERRNSGIGAQSPLTWFYGNVLLKTEANNQRAPTHGAAPDRTTHDAASYRGTFRQAGRSSPGVRTASLRGTRLSVRPRLPGRC